MVELQSSLRARTIHARLSIATYLATIASIQSGLLVFRNIYEPMNVAASCIKNKNIMLYCQEPVASLIHYTRLGNSALLEH